MVPDNEMEEMSHFLSSDKLAKERDGRGLSTKKGLPPLSGVLGSCALLVVFCLMYSQNGAIIGRNTHNEEVSFLGRLRRKLLPYSEVATVPPDPDVLPPDKDMKEELGEKYGRWHFWDGEEENRPDNNNMCDGYPNCDVPGDEFEEDAWQGDAVFVNHILNDADGLVARAMEAIFEEYGHPKPKSAEGLAERMKMFHWDKVDLAAGEGPPEEFSGKLTRSNGGWTTRRSFEGLVRRLLHAIMTSDTFTVVLAGHSSAAGHGNHFRQSYIMQFHRIMAPVFARLGVKLITRNISQGGLGTVQNAMAAGDLYGQEVDLLLWDSGMTEKHNKEHIDLFFRQGLLGGNRVPVVWSAGGNFELLKMLHEEADVDVGEYGHGSYGIPLTTSEEQGQTLPWAVQYMKCDANSKDVCKNHDAYCAKCWVDRKDGIKPEAEQKEEFGSQVSWHPGWRSHQLGGRVLAFAVLEALQSAIQQFSDGTMGGPPLADEYWHVADYYEKIRTKLKNLDPEKGYCEKGIEGSLPVRMCKTPMKGRTQYTPRANFNETGLNAIIKPTADGYVPKNEKVALYEGPDEHVDCYDIPHGEVDVLAIVSGRRRNLEEAISWKNAATATTAALDTNKYMDKKPSWDSNRQNLHIDKHRELDEIVPGKGWQLHGEPQGYCDGGFYSVCGRSTDNNCVLSGHHDARGAIVGTALSGWLVMTLKDLKEGMIVLKVHSWNKPSENSIVADWTTVNNERQRNLVEGEFDEYEASDIVGTGGGRRLGGHPGKSYPDSFVFEYAINGKITRLTKEQYLEKNKLIQRVVEVITLLDDPNFTTEGTDVEVAVRILGCGNECAIGVTHIYWA